MESTQQFLSFLFNPTRNDRYRVVMLLCRRLFVDVTGLYFAKPFPTT